MVIVFVCAVNLEQHAYRECMPCKVRLLVWPIGKNIWPHGDHALDEFLTHLNSQHPAIQFTMEKEEDQKIAFLDVQIERTGVSATTSVFWKKTHTNQYFNYNSHHPNSIKSGVIQCLTSKAEKNCHPTRLPRERQQLRAVF